METRLPAQPWNSLTTGFQGHRSLELVDEHPQGLGAPAWGGGLPGACSRF
jgi:hypothetical protein